VFTVEQRNFQHSVREFAQKEITPFVPQMEQGIFPTEVLKKMSPLGLMGIPIPTTYGGMGADFTSYILSLHELSKVSATIGVILAVHTSVCTNPILYFGTEEQKQHYVPKLASGEYIGAFALTEPQAGSDAGNIRTTAVKKDDYYVLNGSKVFITNGGEADVYIVFAKTNPSKGARGISAFIVDANTEGFIIGKDEKKMGLHGSRTVQLTFEDMRIREKNLLGEEGKGFSIAMANLDVGRIGIAAQSLGIAEASFEYALQYAKETYREDQLLLDNQLIAGALADMATSIEAAKLLVYRAASLRERGAKCGKEASMAKVFASQTAVEIASKAIQLVGEHGIRKHTPVERYFRDAKVTQIYEGTSEIQRIVISKHI
jgi:acyl-CoA dehydrogenase